MGEFKPSGDVEIGRRTSSELTATRSALGAIKRALEVLEYVELYSQTKDPAFESMRRDLVAAQGLLWKYKRTGKPRKAQQYTSEGD